MRFVGILAIEREAESQKTRIFRAFCSLRLPPTRFEPKIPQRSKALLGKIAIFRHLNRRCGDGLETEVMRSIHRILTAAAAFAVSSGVASAAPALMLSDLNMRAGPGIDSPVVITVPGGSTVDVLGCDASGWCSVRFGRRRLHEPSLSRRRRTWAWARLLWAASAAGRVRTAARRRLSRLLLGAALGLGISPLVKRRPFGGTQSFFGSFYRRCAHARFLDLPWCAA